MYEQITKQLQEIDFEVDDEMDKLFLSRVIQMTEVPTRWLAVDSNVSALENQSRFKRIIKWIYQLTSVQQSADVLTGCQSILKKSVHFENIRQRDQLMQLTVLSKENTLSMYVSSVDDLSILF